MVAHPFAIHGKGTRQGAHVAAQPAVEAVGEQGDIDLGKKVVQRPHRQLLEHK